MILPVSHLQTIFHLDRGYTSCFNGAHLKGAMTIRTKLDPAISTEIHLVRCVSRVHSVHSMALLAE